MERNMEGTTVNVTVPAGAQASYEVRIGSGLLGRIPGETAELLPGARPFVVTDANLEKAGHLAAMAGDGFEDVYSIDPPGESSKTIETVEGIIDAMEQKRFGRDTVVLALGGGTVGDVAGFAAAIYKRGVPCVQIPTTTVAQADSAIGGKTGVDSKLSKNAYGAFHNPVRVYVDCATLRTLDDRDYRAGLVESVKHGMIMDAEYFGYMEAHMDGILARDDAALLHLAERNCAIKGRVVAEDPKEKGLRRILNYGHTIGHAVESLSGYALLHGEAVAIGIVGACRVAEALGSGAAEVTARAKAVLEKLGVPLRIEGIAKEPILDTMRRDKKSVGGRARFVLLKNMGETDPAGGGYAVEVPADIVDATLSELGAG
jgi:3-dehydroquinate synthase